LPGDVMDDGVGQTGVVRPDRSDDDLHGVVCRFRI
jgi:hypothetical protein